MKKVCHVISGYHRIDARIFQRQCKSLAKFGYEVSILTNDGEPNEIIENIKFFTTTWFWKSRIFILLFARLQFYKKAIDINADIYQLHSPELISLGLKLKRKGKIVFYDAHEDLPRHILEKDWIPVFLRKPLSFFIEIYMNSILKRYDEIISPHHHVVSNFKQITNNVTVIANFPLVNPNVALDFEHYNSLENIMCYSGTVYSYSNQEVILEAMNNIKDIRYNIAGYIEKSHLQALAKYESFERVKFLGRIPWNDLNKFYKNSILGLVIYDYKLNLGMKLGSFGTNKMFEYMEAGLPIICTNYELWKKVVEKYNCGICVEPNNLSQLESAISFLINFKEKAFEMGQNGRKAILNEYNWESQERIYIELFKKY